MFLFHPDRDWVACESLLSPALYLTAKHSFVSFSVLNENDRKRYVKAKMKNEVLKVKSFKACLNLVTLLMLIIRNSCFEAISIFSFPTPTMC